MTKELNYGYTEARDIYYLTVMYGCEDTVLYNREWYKAIDIEDVLYENYEYRYSLLKRDNKYILKIYD